MTEFLMALLFTVSVFAAIVSRLALKQGRTLRKVVNERNQLLTKWDDSYNFNKIDFENADKVTAGGVEFKRVEVETEEEWPAIIGE